MLAIVAPFLVLAPGGLVDSVEGQVTRPLQIESLGATILFALHHLTRLDLRIEFSHGSYNVAGTGASAVAWAQSLVQVGAVGLTWLLFARGDMSRSACCAMPPRRCSRSSPSARCSRRST